MPNSPESPRPSDEEMTNMQSEAADINKMVNEDLLAPEEASDFDYQNEMEIPKTWLKETPKISERFKKHVISKCPIERFEPKRKHHIHGTSFDALYPLWMGSGKPRTGEYGVYDSPYMSGEPSEYYKDHAKKVKGKFEILGHYGFTGEFGYGPDPETGQRIISESQFPVNIQATWEEPEVIGAIILAKWAPIEGKIIGLQKILEGCSYHAPDYALRDLAVKAKKLLAVPEDRSQAIQNILDTLELTPDEERVLKEREADFYSKKEAEIERRKMQFQAKNKVEKKEKVLKLVESAKSSEKDIAKSAEINLTGEVFKYLKSNLSDEDQIKYIQEHIDYLKDLKNRHKGEELYDWAMRGSDHERIFTVQQMANYAANVMVRGVDRSKIVPIYDWDGNLLWPKDDDTSNPESGNEE